MSELNIYKASAGSGKTFALTMEYFKIIFAVPAEYKNILAVTFTNKATEEMKSRIIRELHKLAGGKPSSYAGVLKVELGFSDDTLKNRAELLRTLLLHDYGRISVTTIDRFFQRIIKSFTRELGIFPGYNVELDSASILQAAVDKVMRKVSTDMNLRTWISDLMDTSVNEGKSWSVKTKIAELGEELFKENYMLFDKETLEKFGDRTFLKTYQCYLFSVISNYENQLLNVSKEACRLIEDAGLELRYFRGNRTGCAAHFYKLQDRKFEDVTKTAREAVGNFDYWVANDSDGKNKVSIEALFPTLSNLLQQCIKIYDDQCQHYLSAKQLAGNLYQLGILNDLYKEVRNYCNEKGVMLLSDTTHILNILIEGNDTSFLFEKSGNYYKHVMIDEFQDTSSMQWANFRPLVVNSLSEDNRAIIVGDVKQSIYRWRNGDWGLLANGIEQEFKQFGIRNVVLPDNWRSAREIVNFNNVFFERAAIKLKEQYDEDAGEDNAWSGAIKDAYTQLSQQAQQTTTGYVDVRFGPEKKEEEGEAMIMEDVVTVINDIRSRHGQSKDIVILVRSGKEGAFVANYLMEYNKKAENKIDFISNDSLYIWSSPYIKFMVAVLKYIIEPYDLVNKATILYFYYAFVKGDKIKRLDRIFKAVKEEELFRFLDTDFAVSSGKILFYSLFETVEAIIEKFSLKKRQEEVPYLIAFQDLIFEYEASNSNSVTLFLEWWEKEQYKRVLSTSEDINAVRILTIHKSKGLEFDYVILPFCSWELDSVRPMRRIWCHNREEEFNKLEYAPLNYSSKLAGTLFKEDYYDEHLKAYVDNLNLLYVALTRAKTELYLRPFMPKFNKDGTPSQADMGAFIYLILENLKRDANTPFQPDEEMNLRYGEKQMQGRAVLENNEVLTLDEYPIYDLTDRISVKYRFKEYTDLGRMNLSAIDEGKLLHEIFKSIEYAEDLEQAVQNVYLAGLIAKKEKAEYCAKIKAYFSNPQAAEWFNRKYKVINERDILLKLGSKVRPDRVITAENSTLVIDYKFGQVVEDKYLKQIRFYRNTLRQMGYKGVKGYIWYVKLGQIVAIE